MIWLMRTKSVAWKSAIRCSADNVTRISWVVWLLYDNRRRSSQWLHIICQNRHYAQARSWSQFYGQLRRWCITAFFHLDLGVLLCQISYHVPQASKKSAQMLLFESSQIVLHDKAHQHVALQTPRKLAKWGCGTPTHSVFPRFVVKRLPHIQAPEFLPAWKAFQKTGGW